MSLLLQVYVDSFVTLHVFRSWSEDVLSFLYNLKDYNFLQVELFQALFYLN